MSQCSDSRRLARAEARWGQIVAERRDLEPAVALQRTLIRRLLELSEALPDTSLTTTAAVDSATHLAAGTPLFRVHEIALPAARLYPVLLDFCSDLAAGGAGQTAEHVREILVSRRLDAASLLDRSFARDQQAIRAGADRFGVSADLLWLVAELALGPVAYRCQAALLEALDLTLWDRGHCPACGSWPALIEVRGGTHLLRCSFCTASWTLSSYRCAYCGDDGSTFTTLAPDSEHPGRRLQMCAACGGYLKAIDVAELTPFPLLAIEDLATADLDLMAIERGYTRPPIPAAFM